jgi:hypothetical protein
MEEIAEQCTSVAIYQDRSQAEEAVCALDRGGISITQVSMVVPDLEYENKPDHFNVSEAARQGALTGAGIGGLFGLLIDAACVWAPGFGPLLVVGPLATALLGGIEGAIAGAAGAKLLDMMSDRQVSKQILVTYRKQLKRGNCLVIVHGSAAEVDQALQILKNTRVLELHPHSEVDVNIN